jgi:hypothetical protein
VRRITDAAARTGASAIVTTTKDAVRLEASGPWPVPLIDVPLIVEVEPAAAFREWVLTRVDAARGASSGPTAATRREYD